MMDIIKSPYQLQNSPIQNVPLSHLTSSPHQTQKKTVHMPSEYRSQSPHTHTTPCCPTLQPPKSPSQSPSPKPQSTWLSWSTSLLQSHITSIVLDASTRIISYARLDPSLGACNEYQYHYQCQTQDRYRTWLRDDQEATWRFISSSTFDGVERAAVGPESEVTREFGSGSADHDADAGATHTHSARMLWTRMRLERKCTGTGTGAGAGATAEKDMAEDIRADDMHANILKRDVEMRLQGFVSCAHVVRTLVPENTFKHSFGFNILST